MIINAVINKEEERNLMMINEYSHIIETLPRGSVIKKKSGYYYLKYRDNGKVVDEYIGKDLEFIAKIKSQIEYRKHCEKMLKELNKERKKIVKIMSHI
ncbi:MAG: hypothetical protein K5765_00195 [Clostridia bacterium]|nr:hypothetical protein [Clostridia bacterium]